MRSIEEIKIDVQKARRRQLPDGDALEIGEARARLIDDVEELTRELADVKVKITEANQGALAERSEMLTERARANAAENRIESIKAWLARVEPYPELNGDHFTELRALLENDQESS